MIEKRSIIDEQIAYYRKRAPEYDQWFLREGRYDRGAEQRQAWFREIATLEAALCEAQPTGDVLELACGTGLWTQHLTAHAATLTAIDASPEAIELNRQRLQSPSIRYLEADLFRWIPDRTYDFIFLGFWLSHVPHDQFDRFWEMIRTALRGSGRVFFVDSLFSQESTATDHKNIDHSGEIERKLNDGSVYHIIKIFYEPASLQQRLLSIGWRGSVRSTGRYFLYGRLGMA